MKANFHQIFLNLLKILLFVFSLIVVLSVSIARSWHRIHVYLVVVLREHLRTGGCFFIMAEIVLSSLQKNGKNVFYIMVNIGSI
jgi:hypothetical protein